MNIAQYFDKNSKQRALSGDEYEKNRKGKE